MAWNKVQIKVNDSEVAGMQSFSAARPIFSLAAIVELKAGESFSVGNKKYIAEKVIDLANRGETLLVEAKEQKHEKSQKGRTDDQTG